MASMNRPRLNPLFMEDSKPAPVKKPRWQKGLSVVGRALRVLVTPMFGKARRGGEGDAVEVRNEVGSPIGRLVRGLLYRLMFVPTLLAILVGVLVVTATHPKLTPSVADPASQGVHYDTVDLISSDNTKLEGWLVPVLDARRVIVEKDDMLHRRYAGVVLVHDFAMSRQQMLPLITPLHEAGYVTLTINLRGQGPSAGVGSTFGLNESQDVRAGVEALRRRRFIDPDAIAVVGVGTGASAALLAAREDPRLKVMVLDHPVRDFDVVVNERLGPQQDWLHWVKPMCKWAFEIAYKVDAEEINFNRFADLLVTRKVLVMDDATETVSCTKPQRTREVVDFLKKHMPARRTTAGVNIIQKDRVGSDTQRAQPIRVEDEGFLPQKRAADILDRAW